jgi:serine phosphatase RsbU (regulator of sigma subunit)
VGDRVVFYTDGLTEVENSDGDQFGECGIVSALESIRGRELNDVCDHIVSRAADYGCPDHKWDDVTVLAVEMTG